MTGIYFFFPYGTINFENGLNFNGNSNFSSNSNESVQFYPNMRFPTKEISYQIKNCSVKKKNDMESSFSFLSNKTVLKFYSTEENEEITVNCDNKNKLDGIFFIAGEGGPTNITQTEKFNVITHGDLLLLKESKCSNPNIGIHELLHVLGFDHSQNPDNLMYYLSSCDQTIGEDIIETINKLYSTPAYFDLEIKNLSGNLSGRYLNLEATIKNNGLIKSSNSTLFVYIDEKLLKSIEIDEISIGAGKKISFTSMWVLNRNINEIKFIIESNSNELDKENNIAILKIKN